MPPPKSICNILRVLLACGSVVCATPVAHGQATIHVPADQSTIQAAIQAAANGDTVLVAPGTYHEHLDFLGKTITVISSGGAAQTIVDGSGQGPVVQFLSGETRASVINGFTLQNGGYTGGISLPEGQISGGVLVNKAAPTIINNVIQKNGCYNVDIEQASPLLQNNDIKNAIPTYFGACSGVSIGAGVFVDGALGEAPQYPGVLSPGAYTPSVFIQIIGNTIENNNDIEDVSDSGGGGIKVMYGYTFIQNNLIRNNFSQQTGGGINISHPVGFYDTTVIENNLIYGNTSPCGGAGLAFAQSTVSSIGQPYYYVVNNTIVDNIVAGTCADNLHASGSQVYLWQDYNRYILVNNIIAGTSTTQPALYCETLRQQYPAYHLAILDHNDVFNASGAAITGQCLNGTGTYGNISADPLFVSRLANDYRLTFGSPAIDSGNNSAQFLAATDYAGNARQLDATTMGYPVADMGAYEFTGLTDAKVTTVMLTPSAYQIAVGGALTLSAALLSANGLPMGTLGFYQDGTLLGYGTINAAGVAAYAVPTTMPGAHAYTAIFTPSQAGFTKATSVKTFVVVGTATTTVTLSSSLNPSVAGQSVVFSVTSQSSDATYPGPITLSEGPTTLATLTLTNGSAKYTTSTLSSGAHLLTATYAGDSSHPSATATLTQIVNAAAPPATATTNVSSSLNPSNTGQTVTFTATVTTLAASGAATGSVTFYDGSIALGTVALSLNNGCSNCTVFTDTATFATSVLAAGVHTITASYVPSGNFAASSSILTQTVNAVNLIDTLTLTCPSGAVLPYTGFSLGAQVVAGSGTPAGTVALTVGGQSLSLTLANGAGAISAKGLAAGAYTVMGAYSSANGYAASTSTCNLSVVAGGTTTTIAANPTTFVLGQSTTLSVAVSSPSGPLLAGDTVTFTSSSTGTNMLGTAPLDTNGKATFMLAGLPTGAQTLTATFSGDASFASSVGTVNVTVTPAASTTTLTATPTRATAFGAVTLTAHVAAVLATLGVPQGSVIFSANGARLGSVTLDAFGNASLPTTSIPAGTATLQATYQGSTDFTASTSLPLQELIDPAPTSVQLTITPSPQYQSLAVALSAFVSSPGVATVPAGNVQFLDLTSGTPVTLATAGVGGSGVAAASATNLAPGNHLLAALYVPGAGGSFSGSQSASQTLIILPSDFNVKLSTLSLWVRTEYHAPLGITLTSIGNFSGRISLSCENLPAVATCTFDQQDLTLLSSGSANTAVLIDTDALPRFKSSNSVPTFARTTLPLVALLPAALFFLIRRRTGISSLLAALALATFTLTTMAGCSGKYPDHTPPGTYAVTIRASSGNQSHTATVSLIVTP